ncbi:MAG: alpha/beta hydrolase [Cellvibrio sp.]|uniref:alpha/beta fold hydrolase n=1 Tax=Cellvibrio sp. TaxID=1965322 RepID=UPI0031AEEB0A
MKHFILLRGLAREAAHWLDFPEILQQVLGDEYQLHLVDFPGCGKYINQDALTSVAAMTDHARSETQVIAARGDEIYLLGISMGGMVALDWAQRFPRELRRLVLINSSAGNQPLWWRLRPSAWPRMIHALVASSNEREAAVLTLVSNNRDDYTQHINLWRNIQQQRPVTRATIVTMLRAAASFHPQPTCAVAGLVIASEQDRMVSVQASNAIARQFNWPIIHHPSAGHDLPMDNPQWLANQISRWIHS